MASRVTFASRSKKSTVLNELSILPAFNVIYPNTNGYRFAATDGYSVKSSEARVQRQKEKGEGHYSPAK